MTIAISFGKYGGFYLFRGYTKRLCLGWMAITYFPCDIDEILMPDHTNFERTNSN